MSRITEYQSGTRTRKLVKKINVMRHYYRNKKINQLEEIVTEVSNTIKALSNRIKNYDQRNKTRTQNGLFKDNPKKFYRQICKKSIEINTPPRLTNCKNSGNNYMKPGYITMRMQNGYLA